MHNSGWVQSPGKYILMDPVLGPHLEEYVKGVVGTFGADHRVLAWDVWNEPDNINSNSCASPPGPALSPRFSDALTHSGALLAARRVTPAAPRPSLPCPCPADTASEPVNKVRLVMQLLPSVFRWAREARAYQPLTSGIWNYEMAQDGLRLR